LPDGRTWEQLPQHLRDRITGVATALRERLEQLGWKRPDVPGRTWSHPEEVPQGVVFHDPDYGGTWVRHGEDVASISGEFAEPTYKARSFERGTYVEVLPA